MIEPRPRLIVLAGPNGAGKSSAAPAVLRDFAGMATYVNADVIALGLSAFRPDEAAVEAGRVMLRRVDALIERREDFAFESTLAGVTARRLIERAHRAGYESHLFYYWLPDVELAIARVRLRVLAGGHDVPENTIRRRFDRSLHNFSRMYRALVTAWRVYDGSGPEKHRLIAESTRGSLTIHDAALWIQIEHRAFDTNENPP